MRQIRGDRRIVRAGEVSRAHLFGLAAAHASEGAGPERGAATDPHNNTSPQNQIPAQ